MVEYFAKTEADTLALAGALGRFFAARDINVSAVVLLKGQLGAGKTTFVRGLLRAIGHTGTVKSPTFTLVEPYEINGLPVYHFDLYRLAEPEELAFLGVDDYLDGAGLCLIEWAENGGDLLPDWDLNISLDVAGMARNIVFTPNSALGEEACDYLSG